MFLILKSYFFVCILQGTNKLLNFQRAQQIKESFAYVLQATHAKSTI